MRDYTHIDEYLNELAGDVYAQPEDEWHTQMTYEVLNQWIAGLDIVSVLDVGCGATAISEPFFREHGVIYMGISLGEDVDTARKLGKNVFDADMSFVDLTEGIFDLVWARHVLEHSPMPLLTLMEWHRIARKWLCLIMPNPTHFTYVGRNHYSVMEPHHIVWLLRRAGWKVVQHQLLDMEFRFLCEKQPRISYEGYAEIPLSKQLHEFERDTFVEDKE